MGTINFKHKNFRRGENLRAEDMPPPGRMGVVAGNFDSIVAHIPKQEQENNDEGQERGTAKGTGDSK